MGKNRFFAAAGTALMVGTYIFLSMKREPEEYSDKWFRSLSREELDVEQEKIQKQWCSVKGDYSLGILLQSLLYRFADEMRFRDHGDLKPENYEYPPHREHGWNLYKPD